MKFFEVLELSRPQAISDLDQAIGAVIEEVREKNSPASLGLSIKVTPKGSEALEIKDEIRVNMPKVRGESRIVYIVDGKPTNKKPKDPKQPEFQFDDPPPAE